MTLPSNFALIVTFILVAIIFVYFLLPKINLGSYGNAFLKSAIAICAIGYIAFDNFKQEKYTIVVVLIVGAFVFTYVAFNAKEKK